MHPRSSVRAGERGASAIHQVSHQSRCSLQSQKLDSARYNGSLSFEAITRGRPASITFETHLEKVRKLATSQCQPGANRTLHCTLLVIGMPVLLTGSDRALTGRKNGR